MSFFVDKKPWLLFSFLSFRSFWLSFLRPLIALFGKGETRERIYSHLKNEWGTKHCMRAKESHNHIWTCQDSSEVELKSRVITSQRNPPPKNCWRRGKVCDILLRHYPRSVVFIQILEFFPASHPERPPFSLMQKSKMERRTWNQLPSFQSCIAAKRVHQQS